jgi:hypothetical protein
MLRDYLFMVRLPKAYFVKIYEKNYLTDTDVFLGIRTK